MFMQKDWVAQYQKEISQTIESYEAVVIDFKTALEQASRTLTDREKKNQNTVDDFIFKYMNSLGHDDWQRQK